MNERCLGCRMFIDTESDVAARAKALGIQRGIYAHCMLVASTNTATLTMADYYRDLESGEIKETSKSVSSTAPEFCPQR